MRRQHAGRNVVPSLPRRRRRRAGAYGAPRGDRAKWRRPRRTRPIATLPSQATFWANPLVVLQGRVPSAGGPRHIVSRPDRVPAGADPSPMGRRPPLQALSVNRPRPAAQAAGPTRWRLAQGRAECRGTPLFSPCVRGCRVDRGAHICTETPKMARKPFVFNGLGPCRSFFASARPGRKAFRINDLAVQFSFRPLHGGVRRINARAHARACARPHARPRDVPITGRTSARKRRKWSESPLFSRTCGRAGLFRPLHGLGEKPYKSRAWPCRCLFGLCTASCCPHKPPARRYDAASAWRGD